MWAGRVLLYNSAEYELCFFFVCFVLLSFNIDGQQNKKVAHLSQTSKSVVFLLFFVVVGLVWTSLAIDGYPLLLLYIHVPKYII